MAKFEKVLEYQLQDFALPVRKTAASAGYDFVAVEDIVISSHFSQMFKLLKEKFTSKEFIAKLGDLKVVDQLMDLSTLVPSMTDKQRQTLATELLVKYGPEVLSFIQDEMTIDLDGMKQLTKASNSKMTLVPTGVKVQLAQNQKLELMIRSSSPLHSYLMLANGVGLIDSDYYNNSDNEGHIFFQIINMSPFNIKINKGDIIGQGVISTYDKTVDDMSTATRDGGLGSTTIQK